MGYGKTVTLGLLIAQFPAIILRQYLVIFFTFGLVEAQTLFVYSNRIGLVVTEVARESC